MKTQGFTDSQEGGSVHLKWTIPEWLAVLKGVQDRADGTLARYRHAVRRMLDDLGDPRRITPGDLNHHLLRLVASGARPATIAGAIAALRSYFDYLCIIGHLSSNPARRIRGPRIRQAEAPHLTVGETRRLIYPPESSADPLEARADVLVAVSYVLGLRASEPGTLLLDDLEWDGEYYSVLVRDGKWSSCDVRLWIYDREVTRRLGAWLTVRDELGGPALFPTLSGGSPCSKTAERDFASCLRRRGIRPRGRELSFHVLRHSLGTHLTGRGISLAVVAGLLRHADPKTTARYIHTRRDDHERLWRTHHPLERPRDVVDMSRVARVLHHDLDAVLRPTAAS